MLFTFFCSWVEQRLPAVSQDSSLLFPLLSGVANAFPPFDRYFQFHFGQSTIASARQPSRTTLDKPGMSFRLSHIEFKILIGFPDPRTAVFSKFRASCRPFTVFFSTHHFLQLLPTSNGETFYLYQLCKKPSHIQDEVSVAESYRSAWCGSGGGIRTQHWAAVNR